MNRGIVVHEAKVAVLAAEAREILVIQLFVQFEGNIIAAHAMTVKSPPALRNDYCDLLAEAESSRFRTARKATAITPGSSVPARTNLKPNERCWCGSGNKFKKCHGHK